MLTHLSHKFRPAQKPPSAHEPRAALFLNRFTRTLTIMYATTGIQDILGISSADLQGKSFYYCIAENCLADAVRCLENAKGNDSIAYLRFWFRNPLQPDSSDASEAVTSDSDVDMTDSSSSRAQTSSRSRTRDIYDNAPQSASSADSTAAADTHAAIFGTTGAADSSASSVSRTPSDSRSSSRQIELEAVVSCASDGLVVCLRRARPRIPDRRQRPAQTGFFAAPWAEQPSYPSEHQSESSSRSSISSGGPDHNDFMAAIRDQAVFAWALTGINGNLHAYATGSPLGESTPSGGMPIWQNDSSATSSTSAGFDPNSRSSVSSSGHDSRSPVDSRLNAGNDHRAIFGDPGLKHTRNRSDAGPSSGK